MIYGIASVVLFVLIVLALYFIFLHNKGDTKYNETDNTANIENLIMKNTEDCSQSQEALERFEKLENDFLDFLGDEEA